MEIEGSSPINRKVYGDLVATKDQDLFDLDLKVNDLIQQYQDTEGKNQACSLNTVTCSCMCSITSSCWCH